VPDEDVPEEDYPTRLMHHHNDRLYIAGNGGGFAWDSRNVWADDVSWDITFPLGP
jgi:hypothetical protein